MPKPGQVYRTDRPRVEPQVEVLGAVAPAVHVDTADDSPTARMARSSRTIIEPESAACELGVEAVEIDVRPGLEKHEHRCYGPRLAPGDAPASGRRPR